jgi:hypothetical protein
MPTVRQCRKRLAVIWLGGAGILFFLLIFQTIFKHYGERASDAWSWFLPTILPTLSLIIAVLVWDALQKAIDPGRIDRFMYRLTCVLSVLYLVAVGLTFFLSPFSPWTPLELMKQSSLYLGPFQGLVAGALGAFFVSKPQR